MKRVLLAGAVLWLLLAMGAPPAQATGQLVAAVSSIDLGLIDAGGQRSFEFPLNNTGDTALDLEVSVSMRREHQIDAEGWIRAESTTFQIPPHGSRAFHATLNVPAGAHSGEYLAYVSFVEPFQSTETASARGGLDIPVSFTVTGVDLWGQVNLPGVVEPERDYPEVSLVLINYRTRGIRASAVLQLIQDEQVAREWSTTGLDLPFKRPGTFQIPFNTRGLANGSYTLRAFGAYTAEDGRHTTGAVERSLWVGTFLIDVKDLLVSTGGESIALPPGVPYTLPAATTIDVGVGLESHAPDTFRVTLLARFGPGAPEAKVSPLVFPGRSIVDLGRLATPDQPGDYRLEFFQEEEGTLLPVGYVPAHVVVPRIRVTEVSVNKNLLIAKVESPDVTVDATLILRLKTPSDTVAWATTENIHLVQGKAERVARPIEPPLPRGHYRLEWTLSSPGKLEVQGAGVAHGGAAAFWLRVAGPYLLGLALLGTSGVVVAWTRGSLRRRPPPPRAPPTSDSAALPAQPPAPSPPPPPPPSEPAAAASAPVAPPPTPPSAPAPPPVPPGLASPPTESLSPVPPPIAYPSPSTPANPPPHAALPPQSAADPVPSPPPAAEPPTPLPIPLANILTQLDALASKRSTPLRPPQPPKENPNGDPQESSTPPKKPRVDPNRPPY